MKNIIKYILQKILGLHNYLFLFAQFVILKFPFDKNEFPFLKFLQLINKPDTILDIGANIGVTTYFFSKKFPAAIIYSFEPVPDNIAVLEKNIRRKRMRNVTIQPFALGAENGKATIVMPESNGVFFHGLSYVNEGEKNVKGKKYQVNLVRLDDIIKTANSRISAIKIDVENYEFNVLKGGEKTLRKNRPLIYCELWENENRTNCFSFLKEMDYKIFIYKKGVLKEFDGENSTHNFFFIPFECCGQLKLS